MPDLISYHQSVTAELDATKNRIRNLVTHWATDGEWKEAALRTVLRRHLPTGISVGRGFVVGREFTSTQIDVLILKTGKPFLFRDGELSIVTPDVPAAIVEVKTRIEGPARWDDVFEKLAATATACKQVSNNEPWLGVFAYEGDLTQVEHALRALSRIYRERRVAIHSIAFGHDLFVRYWPIGQRESGDPIKDANRRYWRAYQLEHLAPSYFVSNLVDGVSNLDRQETDYAWFAYPEGKRAHMLAEEPAE